MPIVSSSAYNSVRTVTTLIRSMLNDAGLPGLPIGLAAIQRSLGEVFVTTVGPHGVVLGDQVTVNVPADPLYAGTFSVDGVSSPLMFSYPQLGFPDSLPSPAGATVIGVGLGNWATDAVLLPLLNSSYRRVQRALAMAGQTTFKTDYHYLVVPAVVSADPGIEVLITDTSPAPPNNLPVDLIEPLFLWERPNTGAGNIQAFSEMTDLTNSGGLPSIVQSQSLRLWEWREDAIALIGALQDTQIRIRYKKGLAPLTSGTSQVLIRDSQECLADMCCALATLPRGGEMYEIFDTAAEDSLNKLINAATRQQQRTVRRRRPYRARRGLRSGFFF